MYLLCVLMRHWTEKIVAKVKLKDKKNKTKIVDMHVQEEGSILACMPKQHCFGLQLFFFNSSMKRCSFSKTYRFI